MNNDSYGYTNYVHIATCMQLLHIAKEINIAITSLML